MPPSPQSDPSAEKLRTAIGELEHTYDNNDDHALRKATKEHRGQFTEAVGDHRDGAAVLRAISRGEASTALGLARKLLQELDANKPANNPTTTTPSVGVAASK